MALGYDDLGSLVDALRRENPRTDPRPMSDAELAALVAKLDDLGSGRDGTAGDFEEIRAIWHWG
ncbi:MAG TPA: hypothetical protein VGH27_28285 [Streptosporangiaceae bacterium]|jgi:hypothetical protein